MDAGSTRFPGFSLSEGRASSRPPLGSARLGRMGRILLSFVCLAGLLGFSKREPVAVVPCRLIAVVMLSRKKTRRDRSHFTYIACQHRGVLVASVRFQVSELSKREPTNLGPFARFFRSLARCFIRGQVKVSLSTVT